MNNRGHSIERTILHAKDSFCAVSDFGFSQNQKYKKASIPPQMGAVALFHNFLLPCYVDAFIPIGNDIFLETFVPPLLMLSGVHSHPY